MDVLKRESPRGLGSRLSDEFECPKGPLPADMKVLLWLMDGAERRRRIAAEWSGHSRKPAPKAIEPARPRIRK